MFSDFSRIVVSDIDQLYFFLEAQDLTEYKASFCSCSSLVHVQV